LSDIGASPSSAATEPRRVGADTKKLTTWLKSHKVVRPYFFKPHATLMRLASAIFADDEILGVTTAAGIRKKIVSFLERFPDTVPPANDLVEPPPPTADEQEAAEAAEAPSLTKAQTLLRMALQSSYLPKLEGKGKVYARRGLALEKPLLDRVLRHSDQGLTPMKVLELGCAPLVLRKNIGRSCVGGSVDAVARVVVNREMDSDGEDSSGEDSELIVVEVKSRVTANTEQQERRRQGRARLAAANSRERHAASKKYWEINAQSELFQFFVDDEKEAVQILHHAVVYDVRYVLLLMGNGTADVISGIFIRFDESLKDAWKNVLEDMGRISLSWAYDGTAPDFDRTILDPVLSTITLHNKKDAVLDFDSFRQWVLLWHGVRFGKALPLPPIARIVPMVISMWNSFKGGSDSLTKLIWNADYDPPTDDIQAHAVARLLLLGVTVIHRLRHMATSKSDLNKYRSLRHYRNAANKRSTFHKTLLDLSICFGGNPDLVRDEGITFAIGTLPPLPSGGRRTRFAAVADNSFGAATTGKTPQRNASTRMQTLMDTADDSLTENERYIVHRWKHCVGPLVYTVNDAGNRGPKRSCFLCQKQTSWTCLGCHESFCGSGEPPEQAGRPKRRKITLPSSDGTTTAKSFVVRNSCWLQKHIDALERHGGSTSSSTHS
jgi:hypothetical protein